MRIFAGKRILLIALALLLVPVAVYAAPDRTGKWDAGVNVSELIPDDDEVDGTVYVGGTAAYGVTEWFALGVESGWASLDVEDSSQFFGFSDWGELTGIPLMGDFILRVPIKDSPVNPYAVVGLGVIFWDFDESDRVSSLGVEVDVDAAFAAKFGAGFDWFINDNWIINFEGGYVMSDTDVTLRVGGVSATANIETDYWMIGGGIKYLF